MAKVKLENVTRRSGVICPVRDISLEVEDRDFVCLLGPSGSGKTTILRLIAGLEVPEEGNIYIGESLVNDIPPAERDTAMVFQSYALYPNLPVFDNLSSPLKAVKMPENEISKRVKEVSEVLHIGHLLDRMPVNLSGGEMQRVALGRAIIRRPKVYLFDEPLTNLDARLRVHMRAELKRLQRDLGQTTIYATHDQLEAMTMADKIAVMRRGALIQYDASDNIYNHPKNVFVADFVGSPSMNFIDCTLVEEDGRAFLDASEFRLDVSEFRDLIRRKSTGSELILGIRPGDITVHRKRVRNAFQTKVYVVEPMGSMTVLDLRMGDDIVKVKAPATFKADVDEEMWMVFDRKKIHVFDKKTGEAIV